MQLDGLLGWIERESGKRLLWTQPFLDYRSTARAPRVPIETADVGERLCAGVLFPPNMYPGIGFASTSELET